MTMLKSEKMSMTLSGVPEPYREFDADGLAVYRQDAGDRQVVETVVEIHGAGEIHWPNREGEKFRLADIHQSLKKYGRARSGISLCWPATASVQAVGLFDGDSIHIFYSDPDPEGRARFLNLSSEKPGAVTFRFEGASANWKLISRLLPAAGNTTEKPTAENSMYQIGLIGLDGECAIPWDRGFDVLAEAGAELVETFGTPVPGDIIHIFGYAAGHDRGYPDYTPSEKLGGDQALKSAIGELQSMGFEVSLYVNARLAERSGFSSYPSLQDSILTDTDGSPVIEIYNRREFYVMNPSSPEWINHLLQTAAVLKEMGASWIQLDQIAGRAAVAAPGEAWGLGYRKLIDKIRASGIKIWIQGVCDFYPADAYEATWRAVSVLEDGTLRGGWPLGRPDTGLLETLGFNGHLIIPRGKSQDLKASGLPKILDRNSEGEDLPLWGSSWLKNLKKMQLPRCGVHKKL